MNDPCRARSPVNPIHSNTFANRRSARLLRKRDDDVRMRTRVGLGCWRPRAMLLAWCALRTGDPTRVPICRSGIPSGRSGERAFAPYHEECAGARTALRGNPPLRRGAIETWWHPGECHAARVHHRCTGGCRWPGTCRRCGKNDGPNDSVHHAHTITSAQSGACLAGGAGRLLI
jgi:hypothetical protein